VGGGRERGVGRKQPGPPACRNSRRASDLKGTWNRARIAAKAVRRSGRSRRGYRPPDLPMRAPPDGSPCHWQASSTRRAGLGLVPIDRAMQPRPRLARHRAVRSRRFPAVPRVGRMRSEGERRRACGSSQPGRWQASRCAGQRHWTRSSPCCRECHRPDRVRPGGAGLAARRCERAWAVGPGDATRPADAPESPRVRGPRSPACGERSGAGAASGALAERLGGVRTAHPHRLECSGIGRRGSLAEPGAAQRTPQRAAAGCTPARQMARSGPAARNPSYTSLGGSTAKVSRGRGPGREPSGGAATGISPVAPE